MDVSVFELCVVRTRSCLSWTVEYAVSDVPLRAGLLFVFFVVLRVFATIALYLFLFSGIVSFLVRTGPHLRMLVFPQQDCIPVPNHQWQREDCSNYVLRNCRSSVWDQPSRAIRYIDVRQPLSYIPSLHGVYLYSLLLKLSTKSDFCQDFGGLLPLPRRVQTRSVLGRLNFAATFLFSLF